MLIKKTAQDQRRRASEGDANITVVTEAPSTTIQKVFRLMEVLLSAVEPQPLMDLADQLETPKPTVHRLLSQLEAIGIVQRDLSRKDYTVGPKWLHLSVEALRVRARQPPVRSIIRKLVDQIGESCNLGVLQDDGVVYLERVECDWPLRMQLEAGSRVPIHCTASGKLLLAHTNARMRKAILKATQLKRFTTNTITDPDQLEQECETVRKTGISVNREEYHLGLIGVAVPVFRHNSTVVAALAVHAPSFRMSVDVALSHVSLLRKAAAEIAIEGGLLGG